LQQEYRIKERDDVYAELMRRIGADETKDNAFAIHVESSSPQKAVDMAKYMIYLLNKTAVFLNTQKQHDNALFLEKRYMKIKSDLASAEDSLRQFQKSSGYIEANEQLKSSIEVYARMEADVANKEIEAKLMEKMYGASSPQYLRSFDAYSEYDKKLQGIKSGKDMNSVLVGLSGIPEKSIQYLRLYRNIKINSAMLEYIIPIYEQVRFEEQKQTPVIQIVDTPSMPEKRSGPKRVLTALIITICTSFFTFLYMYTKHRLDTTENPKLLLIRDNLRVLKRKK
jgi:capsule polysaccharide export protein KpsE/RkpR